MNILETEWWTVGVPAEWWAEREEDGIVIGDRDGVGAIEISTLHATAAANGEPEWCWTPFDAGVFSGFSCAYHEDGDAVREWYLACGAVMLFITYCCDAENSDLDMAAVEEILRTLAPISTA